ncbi:MAG: glycosyl transferase family protein [Pseudomonadota bacterium]
MRAFTLPVTAGIFVNGLDDLFIDANYYLRGLFGEKEQRIFVEDLRAAPAKRIALMVPAWHEAGVIRQMLESNLQRLDYPLECYDIFVGTYKNDEETQRRVDEVARRVDNVHKVVTPHDGPTCKADCLNWIYQGIQVLEEQRGVRFDILLMHDAEDIIHPLALRLYSYLIPEHDFVQTPVFPLETPWHKFVAATYKDEFTEHHLKDMLVREKLGGLVPSAGVGSAFARDVFEEIALAHEQEAFNVGSMTEDYEIGLKFRLAGKKVYFACRAVYHYVTVEKGIFRKRQVRMVEDEYIATREYFPDSFKFAVRQRSRWVLGITLQGWEQVGWSGPLPVLYCLWRDRKALLTHFFTIAAYLVALYCLGRMGLGWALGRPWSIENIFPPGSALWWLVMLNSVILLWRFAMKMIAVHRIYGGLHAVLSIPRLFLANIINFMATAKALRQYLHHRITKEPLRWLKTDHVFPSTEALAPYHRRLGDLLLEREGLSREDLDQALNLHSRTRLPLGDVLHLTGLAPRQMLHEALAAQLDLRIAEPESYKVPIEVLERLPEAEARRLQALPQGWDEEGRLVVVVNSPPDRERDRALKAYLGSDLSYAFCSQAALDQARDRAYRRLGQAGEGAPSRAPLGERLVAEGLLEPGQLTEALAEQAHSGGFLGELLLQRGWVGHADLHPRLADLCDWSFAPLAPEAVDPAHLRTLGYGFCALYRLVPLRAEAGAPVVLAAAQRLSTEALGRAAHRLGCPVTAQLSPATDLLLALAVGAQRAWPSGLAAGVSGMDGAVLAALQFLLGPARADRALWEAARHAGRAPLDHALRTGLISEDLVPLVLEHALGLGRATSPPGAVPIALPPHSSLRRAGVRALRVGTELVLQAPSPCPMMTVEVAQLMPHWPLGWQIETSGDKLAEQPS